MGVRAPHEVPHSVQNHSSPACAVRPSISLEPQALPLPSPSMGDTAMSSSWRKDRGGAVAAGLEGAPLGSSRAHSYIIQSGDTLWEIAYERNLSAFCLRG